MTDLTINQSNVTFTKEPPNLKIDSCSKYQWIPFDEEKKARQQKETINLRKPFIRTSLH